MTFRAMCLGAAFALLVTACGDDRPSGGPGVRLDGGGAAAVPGEADQLGALATDCVEYCRALFTTCTRVQVCFFDAEGSCTPQDATASSCAMACGNTATVQAALDAVGCTEQYRAYEGCVATNVAAGACDIYNEECGIEWGVYASCAGL